MKIFRLACFNMKKHRTESISLFVLIMLCMALISTAITGISNTEHIFDEAFERSGCVRNFISIPENDYRDEYGEYFANDERLESFFQIEFVQNSSLKYLDKDGNERSFTGIFTTLEEDAEMETLLLESSMDTVGIFSMEHPIIMPFYAKDVLNYQEGDTFRVIYNEKVYPFTIAGFYESGFFSSGIDMKSIISHKDYNMFNRLFGRQIVSCFEMKNPDEAKIFMNDFFEFAETIDEEAELGNNFNLTFEDEKEYRLESTTLFMKIMLAMSVVVFISIAFMIMFRIKNDIDEQMVSIGVLEALGYKSGEISLTYVIEYMLIALPAVLCGFVVSLFTSPILINIGETLIGHHSDDSIFNGSSLAFGGILLLVVAAISFFESGRIKKLPPVVAFRKGSANRKHTREFLPLEKTKTNIHIRLAAKGFFADLKANIGMGICIAVSVISLMVCFVLFDFTNNGVELLLQQSGIELSDMGFIALAGTDTDALRSEIESMPEVKKVLLLNNTLDNAVKAGTEDFSVLAYEDYSSLEYISAEDGRMPEHDNEVAIVGSEAKELQKNIGDTLTLRIGKIEKDYTICGFVSSGILSISDYVYMTPDGYKRLNPSFVQEQVDIFLNEGEDVRAFKQKIISLYGEASDENLSGGTLEERIKSEADKKISALLEMYGVNHIDYAIKIDDEIIKGSSSRFKIQSFTFIVDIIRNSFEPIIASIRSGTGMFMLISAYTAVMIIFLIISLAVRRQRTELGIMKGMGYTSRELMLQTASRIIPILVISVVTGSIGGIGIARLVYSKYGELPVMMWKIVLLALAIVAFGFAVAYLSARKIKKISVYELMQE